MKDLDKVETYLRAILNADDIEAAKREARLAMAVIGKGKKQ